MHQEILKGCAEVSVSHKMSAHLHFVRNGPGVCHLYKFGFQLRFFPRVNRKKPINEIEIEISQVSTSVAQHHQNLSSSLKEAFGQNNVPHHENTAGSTWNCSRGSIEVTALAKSFHFP